MTEPLMSEHSLLVNILIYLIAAVLAVPLFKKLGLGSVLGYLVAGTIIGPWGLALITNINDILHFPEFGVVLLLFLIGLELKRLPAIVLTWQAHYTSRVEIEK